MEKDAEPKKVGTKYDLMKMFEQAIEKMTPEEKAQIRAELDKNQQEREDKT